jgi:hypothetical protein
MRYLTCSTESWRPRTSTNTSVEVEVVAGEAGPAGGEVGVENLVEAGFDRDGRGLSAFAGDLQNPGPAPSRRWTPW